MQEAMADKLKVILASTFSLGLKAQNYHWNVTGPNFTDFHDFFQEIYEDLYEDADEYAEFIRILGEFSPGSLSRFSELSVVTDAVTIPSAQGMISQLVSDFAILMNLLESLASFAEESNERILVAMAEEKLYEYRKLQWKLKAHL